jgi:hypothetical protein
LVWWVHLRNGGFLCVRLWQDILLIPPTDTTFLYVIPSWLGLGFFLSAVLIPTTLMSGEYWLALFLYLASTMTIMSIGQICSVFYEQLRKK